MQVCAKRMTFRHIAEAESKQRVSKHIRTLLFVFSPHGSSDQTRSHAAIIFATTKCNNHKIVTIFHIPRNDVVYTELAAARRRVSCVIIVANVFVRPILCVKSLSVSLSHIGKSVHDLRSDQGNFSFFFFLLWL